MTQSWCKVDSALDSHPKVRMAGNFGRQVFEFALRRNAIPGNAVPGLLPGLVLEPWFIADQLMEHGIPAIADKININMVMGGLQPQLWGYGPKIRVRQDDLPKAQAWLKGYEQRRKSKRDDLD